MKKDNIEDFISSWKMYDYGIPIHEKVSVWKRRFDDAGYYRAELNVVEKLGEARDWCEMYFGKGHYVSIGFVFWFETSDDAVIFSLKWP